ncbi:MAG: DUF167 domain-containing protein [Candidatus Lokiarchaeota archaeon]|nr:DUF167 domain-containing protein [Candidatus Lokiarchaeota archaeon]
MPDFLEKASNNTFILHVKVKPNSKKEGIAINDEIVKISVRSKAEQNKANYELLKFLKKKLNIPINHIQILSGIKSVHKTLKIIFSEDITENEFIQKLFKK